MSGQSSKIARTQFTHLNMTRILFLVFMLFPALISAQAMFINRDGVFMRKSRSDAADYYWKLNTGEKVQVLKKDAVKTSGTIWYEVRIYNAIGYVHDSDLSSSSLSKGVKSPAKTKLTKREINDLNRQYWNEGKAIIDNLTKKISGDIEGSFNSAAVAGEFYMAARRINELKSGDSPYIYEEVREDVRRKYAYLALVARKVDGSWFRYIEKLFQQYFMAKAIKMSPKEMQGKNIIPSPNTVWVNDEQLKEIEAQLTTVEAKENETIKIVRTKYQLMLKPW